MQDLPDHLVTGILATPTLWLQLDKDEPQSLPAPFSGVAKARLREPLAEALAGEAPPGDRPLAYRLRRALEQGAFRVVYQPTLDARTGLIGGVEALLRWNDPQREVCSPADFVPVLERTGLIGPVGEWVLRESCSRVLRLKSGGQPLTLSVNLSPRQFEDPALVERMATILHECRFPPSRLEVEVTESMLRDVEHARTTILAFNALGVRVLIDDFGIGYSSLNHLKRLPVAGLKLDRSFIAGMLDNRHDRVITESVIHLARLLDLDIVAEGVEDVRHEHWLRSRGVNRLQGFLYSQGVSARRLAGLLRRQKAARIVGDLSPLDVPAPTVGGRVRGPAINGRRILAD